MIHLTRQGNLLTVAGPADERDSLIRALDPALSYQHRSLLFGADLLDFDQPVAVEKRSLYEIDFRGHVVTTLGLANVVACTLRQAGYQLSYRDQSPAPSNPRAYLVDLPGVERFFSYRARQKECLEAITRHYTGLIEAPTGFGKSAIMAMICLAYPYAKVDVVTKRLAVVDRICRELSKCFPVGRIGGGRKKPGARVTVYSADSLHHSPGTADIVLCDECHELASERLAGRLLAYPNARRFGFTASPEGRFDGADLVLTQLFGDTIFRMTYPEAVALGLVAPVSVLWLDPPCNLTCDSAHSTVRKRQLLWRNRARNQAFAQALRGFQNVQKLTLVETVEHAVHFWREMPEAQLMYAAMEEHDLARYQAGGLLPADYQPIKKCDRERICVEFEQGRIDNVIATGTWAVGVSFDSLQVLCRADGGAGQIGSIQGPGRVSRISPGKERGRVLDSRDSFNDRCAGRGQRRYGHYARLGWEQEHATFPCLDEASG